MHRAIWFFSIQNQNCSSCDIASVWSWNSMKHLTNLSIMTTTFFTRWMLENQKCTCIQLVPVLVKNMVVIVLFVKCNALILYSCFHQTFMFILLVSEVSQLSKPRVSDFGTNEISFRLIVLKFICFIWNDNGHTNKILMMINEDRSRFSRKRNFYVEWLLH